MKVADIKEGVTYQGAKGEDTRTVLAISDYDRPQFWTGNKRPEEPGVLYRRGGELHNTYISSFAKWCRKEEDPVVYDYDDCIHVLNKAINEAICDDVLDIAEEFRGILNYLKANGPNKTAK